MGQMSWDVAIKSNLPQVQEKILANAKRAIMAMALEGVGLTVTRMQNADNKYHKDIYLNGDLQRSIAFGNIQFKTVEIGTNLPYAKYVHNGTRKMPARPFFEDALLSEQGKKRLKELGASYLKQGFK